MDRCLDANTVYLCYAFRDHAQDICTHIEQETHKTQETIQKDLEQLRRLILRDQQSSSEDSNNKEALQKRLDDAEGLLLETLKYLNELLSNANQTNRKAIVEKIERHIHSLTLLFSLS